MTAKVLIVDDESDLLESVEIMLVAKGFNVLKGLNGQQAIELADREQPDIILMDVMMPVMDGIEACKQIKGSERTRQIPLLLITAISDIDSKVKGLTSGADDFVTKPFEEA